MIPTRDFSSTCSASAAALLRQRALRVTALAAMMALSGCSTVGGWFGTGNAGAPIDYRSQAVKTPPLEVPPDLTQLVREGRFAVQSGQPVSASTFGQPNAAVGAPAVGPAVTPAQVGSVRLVRDGDTRRLVTTLAPEVVYQRALVFWKEAGFTIETERPEAGVIETAWAENRGKLPQDFIRKFLGRFADGLFSTGERDRFRTRIERNAKGEVEIYITHRGMVENFADAQKNRTIWQPRAADPELEIEFLRRLMVKLGASPEKAKAETLTARAPKGIEVTTVDGQPTLALTDSMDRAGRRTGVALDRSGFTVEDRDRAKGIYFVRYVAPGTADKEPGFFARLFSSPKEVSTLSRYRIALSDKGNDSSQIRVLNAAGQAESTANASTILKLIANELQ